jgi:ABC-type transporter Mla subunit MlaD
MAALLNELLEEAVTRSTAFADQAAEMQHAAHDTGEKVRALSERVREESAESHGLFADAVAKLKEAESHLGDAEHKAEDEMSALRTKLDEVESKLTALVSAAKTGATELREAKTTISSDLDGRQHEIDGLFDSGQQKAHAIEANVGERLTAMHDALAALQHSVTESQQHLGTAVIGFSENLNQLAQKAQTQTHACVEVVSQATARAAETLTAAGDQIVQTHNDLMELIRKKLDEEIPQQAEATLSKVHDAAQELENLCKTSDELLPGLVEEILKRVGDMVELTERLEPTLAEAARLK